MKLKKVFLATGVSGVLAGLKKESGILSPGEASYNDLVWLWNELHELIYCHRVGILLGALEKEFQCRLKRMAKSEQCAQVGYLKSVCPKTLHRPYYEAA